MATYEAKRQGRNRCVFFDELGVGDATSPAAVRAATTKNADDAVPLLED